jgi:hypothetical protein
MGREGIAFVEKKYPLTTRHFDSNCLVWDVARRQVHSILFLCFGHIF